MAVVGELLLVVQQPLQLFGEVAHLSVVVLRKGFQEFFLILLDVFVDGLRTGSCKVLEPWQCDLAPQQIAPMDERLKEIFGNYEELASLYESPKFDCPNWVLNRWLELLPVDGSQKQHFLAQRECTSLLNYLSALIA